MKSSSGFFCNYLQIVILRPVILRDCRNPLGLGLGQGYWGAAVAAGFFSATAFCPEFALWDLSGFPKATFGGENLDLTLWDFSYLRDR